MCGIAGFTWPERDLLTRMVAAVAHRGPDDGGAYHGLPSFRTQIDDAQTTMTHRHAPGDDLDIQRAERNRADTSSVTCTL